MIIGITGGTGSGKTTLLHLIEAQGGLVLDCDSIYHMLLQSDRELQSAIALRFPNAVEQGGVNRKKLGAIVFEDACALQDLNTITHQAVLKEVHRRLSNRPALAAIDAIGLFEGGLDALCDITVAVTAPENIRVQRIMTRDGIGEVYARKRLASQKSADWYSARCDYTLENGGDYDVFVSKCLAFLQKLGIIKENEKENDYDQR